MAPDATSVSAAIEVALAQAAAGSSSDAMQTVQSATAIARELDDSSERAVALAALAGAAATLNDVGWLRATLPIAIDAANAVESPTKQADLLSKLAVASAALDSDAALAAALRLPQDDDTLAAYKARALAELAPLFAAQGQWALTEQTLAAVTMGLTYYRSVGHTRVARLAPDTAARERYFATALSVARDLEDGYFKAGALRQVAAAKHDANDIAAAATLYAEAVTATAAASSAERRARALSRIATSRADDRDYQNARGYLPRALTALEDEERETMVLWSYYEIAGAAAFAGDAELAQTLVDKIPADTMFGKSPLRPAAERDVAFGLARHGQTARALDTATNIVSTRERVQALARIARLLADPTMASLPRYL